MSVRISDDLLTQCMHCGLCLPVCPTYALTGLEKNSPRGRIRLMKSVADGSPACHRCFMDEMYFCLDCQACQTACPAGVKYGELVESAARLVEEKEAHQAENSYYKKCCGEKKSFTDSRPSYKALSK